jgi:hypothetical protein
LRANERDIRSRNSFDFGTRLGCDAATVTKIKISPGTPSRGFRLKGTKGFLKAGYVPLNDAALLQLVE